MVTGKIGLFGGAGSGKSEAARILKDKYEATVIEADKVAHKLYNKDAAGYDAVVSICGSDILDDKFDIDRKRLADLLYNNLKLLERVNEAVHPLVYRVVNDEINQCFLQDPDSFIVYEAAVLPSENEIELDADIYVFTPDDIRRDRLKRYRGYTDERIDSIFRLQASDKQYRSYCDYVIYNYDNLKRLEEEVDAAVKYCQRKQR